MRTHAAAWLLLVAVVCLCFMGYWGAKGALRVMDSWCDDLPPIEDTDFTNHARESVVMYAADGSTVLAEFQLEKRDPVESDQVSDLVKQATVDTEDVRFYQHGGVDLPGIARAFVNNLAGGSLEGASTITQQLVRNTVLTQEANEISIERKVREAQLAMDLEKQYSKDELLMMYLNTVNYGDGCYGLQAAAQNYFQTDAVDLSLTQAATLAGIPQSPTFLNPKTYPDAALERRNLVLERMLSAGDITQEQCDAAQAEPLNLDPAPEVPEDGIYAYPYFTSYVRNLLMEEDNPFGCSYASLFEGGLTIRTTLNPSLQDDAEAACAAQRARMSGDLDASLVAIDPATGYVEAMVGGGDYDISQVNIATGTGGGGRQAGSTFKAFTLAAAIEKGISPQTRIDCSSPMTKEVDGREQTSENFDNIDYGVRTIQSATAVSANTGYLRLSEEIGQAATTEMAERLGVESPMTPELFKALLMKKDAILKTGLDFINCAELHLNANNIDNYYGENMYISRHGYISPVWSRELTLKLMKVADEENWNLVVHDCSNRTKFARDLNLRGKEGGWFGSSNYACEFSRVPYAAFLPILRDADFSFLCEEELPDGYKPGEIVF